VEIRELQQRRHIFFTPAVIHGLQTWLGGWPGIGRIVAGMTRQGFDLQLARHGGAGWRATFYPAGRTAHSITAVGRVGVNGSPRWGAAMKAQGKVKGILIEGNDDHEYLLGFRPPGRPSHLFSAAGKLTARSSR
jgi:hypothetical protein